MAYNKKQLYSEALELIQKKNLLFIEDVIALLGISKQTFYSKFKVRSNELDNIKKNIRNNRVALKTNIRKKWYESDHFSSQLCLYKLCAEEDELRRLQPARYAEQESKALTSQDIKELADTIDKMDKYATNE